MKKILGPKTEFRARFIPEYKELARVIRGLKKQGKQIVLTQGVYDLIHEGHALYLEKARALSDVLIVGVGSDELTRQRKGPDRPIVPQNERFKMLVHLRHVDIVTIREIHHEMGDLIRLVKPDVLVVSKSTADFTDEMVSAYKSECGKIVSLPPQATTTTTARIRILTMEGVNRLSQEINKLTEKFIEDIKRGR